MNLSTLGIPVLLVGIAIVLMTLWSTRLMSARRIAKPLVQPMLPAGEGMPLLPTAELKPPNDAVLLVQPGGRLIYANRIAQEWFSLEGRKLDLEDLAQRINPAEKLLGLCASEGQTPLTFAGGLLRGSSYFVPTNGSRAMVITLRHVQSDEISPPQTGILSPHAEVLAELSRATASSLDLEATLKAIVSAVDRLVPADFVEITVWDAEEGFLVPYRFHGKPGVDRHLEKSAERYRPAQGYSGYLITERTSLLVADVDAYTALRPVVDRRKYNFRSYLGYPLIVARDIVGTLELGAVPTDAFRATDLEVMGLLSNQAAISLQNAMFHQKKVRWIGEADSLRRLAQSLSECQEINAVFAQLVKNLASLLDVEMLGFLMYDETRHILQAQLPFQGLPAEVVELYRVPIPVASPAEAIWSSRETIVSPRAADDERLKRLGLDASARAAGMINGVLSPLVSAGRNLGYLQIANKRDGSSFNQADLTLIAIATSQAALALENARLFTETHRLAHELERLGSERTTQLETEHRRAVTLLRITTELAVSFDLEVALNRTLAILNEVIDAEQITCLVWKQAESTLRHVASIGYTASPPPEGRILPFRPNEGLAGWVISNRQAALISDVLLDERWLQLPGVISQHRSAIGVPLMVGDEALGALLLFHRKTAHFSADHLDLVQAAANQVALTVKNMDLYSLIRQQAEDLGVLLRIQQVETSRLRAILEAVAEGILVTSADGKISLFNASAERILKLSRGEVADHSLEHFSGLFGKAARAWMEMIQQWSSGRVVERSGETYAEQITLEGGRVVSVHLAPVFLRNEFLGTVSIFHDITHQVEVDRLKSEFVATVSHELRTPLTSIKGYAEVLLMEAAGKLNEQQQHFLQIIKDNVERLTVLLNDLLNISHLEARRVTMNKQSLDLSALAKQALDQLRRRAQAEGKEMTFTLDDSPDPLPVKGDAERIRQILLNLLSNAYLYTPADGSITLRLRQIGEQVQIDVQDTGIGIPLAEQQRVFERFYRGEHPLVLESAGTGLGLAIAKQLVEMHGGSLWLESRGIPGEGSTFSFTLPVN
jgi:PAS domain S-box-containing protein